jgi:transcriptional regulator with XRE-family HTH domain
MRGRKRKVSQLDFERLSIREQINLTQAELADYLGVKASQVGRDEAQIRDLPKRTFHKHLLLKNAYQEGIKKIEDDSTLPPIKEEAGNGLKKEIGDLQYEKTKLLRNL